ncbi:BA14K family protein [Rhizobium wenxiniae]|uniref:BA14K family protein n=1 Tax=Rhizobium wenxiniae TaxID=1737357 RepID=UPI00357135B2
MKLTSEIAQSSAPNAFASPHDEPLWTSGVRRVDPNRQAYQRLPCAVSATTMVAEVKPVERVNVTLGSSEAPSASGERDKSTNMILAEMQAAKAQTWCSARYRSFDPVSNTYQPFTGGRKQCPGPETQSASNSVRNSAIAQF